MFSTLSSFVRQKPYSGFAGGVREERAQGLHACTSRADLHGIARLQECPAVQSHWLPEGRGWGVEGGGCLVSKNPLPTNG